MVWHFIYLLSFFLYTLDFFSYSDVHYWTKSHARSPIPAHIDTYLNVRRESGHHQAGRQTTQSQALWRKQINIILFKTFTCAINVLYILFCFYATFFFILYFSFILLLHLARRLLHSVTTPLLYFSKKKKKR